MRSALIITTFALAVLAAPVPDPAYKNNGQGCVRRVAGRCIVHERDVEATVETNVEATSENDNLENITNRSPEPYTRGKGKVNREVDTTDSSFEDVKYEARSPALHRNKNGRSPALHRNKNGRSTGSSSEIRDNQDEEDSENLLARYTRGGGWKSVARSLESEYVHDDQNKRAPEAEPWTRGSRPSNVLPEAPKQDLQARGYVRGTNKRESDAAESSSADLGPYNTKKASVFIRGAREIETRSAEPEPNNRFQIKGGKAEGGSCPV